MTARYAFHPEAEAEFYDAVDRYEDEADDLGWQFHEAVESAIAQICVFPSSGPVSPDHPGVRQCLVGRFPFYIYYQVARDDMLLIKAVAHTSRRPGYWRDRIDEADE